jgi:biofilm PGA synthesis lipoprotein PgaB
MISSGLVDIQSHTYDLHHRVPDSIEGKWEPAVLAHIVTDKGTENQEEYDQRIESDLLRSRQAIKAKLGTDPDILCWPFGAYDKHINILAKNAGFVYMIGPTTYSNPTTDIENIGRVAVPGGMDIKEFEKLVNPRKVNYFQGMGLELERIKLQLINVFKHG